MPRQWRLSIVQQTPGVGAKQLGVDVEGTSSVAQEVPAGIGGPETILAPPLCITGHDELLIPGAHLCTRLVHDIQESFNSIGIGHSERCCAC